MNITLENNIYSLIASARASWQANSEETSARTGKPLAATPSDSALINDAPPLAQQIEAIEAQEIASTTTTDSTTTNANASASSTSNGTNSPNATSNSNASNNNSNNTNSSTSNSTDSTESDLSTNFSLIGKVNIVA
jgi:hypothetical protein